MSRQVRRTIQAPAKLNLFLAVKGRRPDGYHELESLMVKLELADLVHLGRKTRGLSLSCPGGKAPEDETNLAFRAAQAFCAETGVAGGIHIVLEKKIPVAAGLGGGSSDAAAVLRGLNSLFDTRLPLDRLLDLARPLGADVPFFVSDCAAAWARGIGDRLTETSVPGLGWIVLVNPGFPVATKWVYENFALTTKDDPYILGRGLASAHAGEQHADVVLFNDLESVTISHFPEVGTIKKALIAGGARGALMTGSGPTVFGLFAEKEEARRCYAALSQRYGGTVFLTKPLGAEI